MKECLNQLSILITSMVVRKCIMINTIIKEYI